MSVSKRTLVGMSVLVITFWFASVVTAKIDPKTVVAIWLLDEGTGKTVKDTSGNGHDGTIKGDIKWTKGKFENALDFPGNTAGIVEIPHQDSLNLVNMTLTAWIKISELPDSIAPIYKVQPGNLRNYAHRVWGGGANPNKYALEFTVGPAQWKSATGKTIVVDGKWHHVAGTYDQKAIRVYVDGVFEGEKAEAGKPDPNPGPVLLGARSTKGVLDELGLFNEALDEAQIKDIMNLGLTRALAVDAQGKLPLVWGRLKMK